MSEGVPASPVYLRVKGDIERMIDRGQLRSGGLVPAERRLAKSLGVSLGAVRLAIASLSAEGKLVRVPRKGTFVSPEVPAWGAGCSWALVVPTLRYFYPELVDALEQEAAGHGATIMLGCSRDDVEQERQFVLRAIEAGVRGVLLAPASIRHSGRSRESLEYLADLPVPVVIVDHWSVDLPLGGIDCVLSDNFAGMYQATVHMIRHGYRRIVCVHGKGESSPEVRERRKGYEAAMADHDLGIPDVPPLTSALIERGSAEELRPYVEAGVEAVVVTNDRTASFLLAQLARIGVTVPDQVAVIGYDDEPSSETVNPPLSSVRVEKGEMARRAASMLSERIGNGLKGRHRTMVIRPTVVARASCGRNCPGAEGTAQTQRRQEDAEKNGRSPTEDSKGSEAKTLVNAD